MKKLLIGVTVMAMSTAVIIGLAGRRFNNNFKTEVYADTSFSAKQIQEQNAEEHKALTIQSKLKEQAQAAQEADISEYETGVNPVKPVMKHEISMFGDSLIQGVGADGEDVPDDAVPGGKLSIAGYLQKMTGTYVNNFGAGGETSYDIAVRAGGNKISVDRDLYLTTDSFLMAFVDDENGDLFTGTDFSGLGAEEDVTDGTAYINGYAVDIRTTDITGLVEIRLSDAEINGGVEKLYVPAGTNIDSKAYYEHQGDVIVIEMGSNGGWDSDYETLISQINSILKNGNYAGFLILGDTDDPGLSIGDLNQGNRDDNGDYIGDNNTKWEEALQEEYGDHFFNLRTYLLNNGLSDNNLVPTDEDLADVIIGNVPTVLRNDWTHLNAYGYYSEAIGVYAKGRELTLWK